jgi:hypothetical protein
MWPLRDSADARDSPALDLDFDVSAQGAGQGRAGAGGRPATGSPRETLASRKFWKTDRVLPLRASAEGVPGARTLDNVTY